MLTNVHDVKELRAIALRKQKPKDFMTIESKKIELMLSEGWEIVRKNRSGSARVSRPKKKSDLLEDRVWTLLYRMGYSNLSGNGGAQLAVTGDGNASSQIDVVGLDQEVALAIECKSAEKPRRRANFQNDIAKQSILKRRFVNAIQKQFPTGCRRKSVLIIWTWDIIVSKNDAERAEHEKVVLLDERDLDYYEQLVAHLGPAARYQFLSSILGNSRIEGLSIQVPALRSKIGKDTCYTFSIRPDYLLKIAYVSHRSKGKATDVDTYQRMVRKARLKRIRQYIDENGIFPTNIVVNIDGKRHVRFEPSKRKGSKAGADYGYLYLTPSYGCAWIIDGQHRLFGYSGHKRASTSYLNVLAFEGLPPSQQAQLFIDINHEQKSVKRSLLHELYAELNWNDEDESKRASAIVSKAIQALNEKQGSPFYNRILLADGRRTHVRCISLETMFKALTRPGLFIVKPGLDYGPLWAGENTKTMYRTIAISDAWFSMIRDGAPDWWEVGADEGGGLAMNDAVTACFEVLRSVFGHLTKQGINLVQLTNEEVISETRKYGEALGDFLGRMSSHDRLEFRAGARGVQGQTATRRRCEEELHRLFSDFNPPGLKDALDLEAARTNDKARVIILSVETALKDFIVNSLKSEFDSETWWYEGVPKTIRLKVDERRDDEKGRGLREDYFDLIDYRDIALSNWTLFQDTLAFGKKGNKSIRTQWLVKMNDARKTVMHASKGRNVGFSDLQQLEEFETWLNNQLAGIAED